MALLGSSCNPRPPVPVFLWHAVGEGSGDRYDLSVEELDQELTLLERYGAATVTLDALFEAREGKGALPPRAVVLTFDDGRACLFRQALPLLLKHHMRAEVFVSTAFLAEEGAPRVHNTDATGEHAYLTWPELREMVRSGAFVAEPHGVSHARLPDLPVAEQRREMVESGRVLRERLGLPAHFFAYPFGASTWTTRRLAESAGYRGALSVGARLGYTFAVPRTSLRRGTFAAFAKALGEAFGPPPK